MAEQNRQSAVPIAVTIGSEVGDEMLISVSCEQDLDMPDMCVVALRNEGNEHTGAFNLGDAMEFKGNDETIFKGEVVAVEARYRADGANILLVRGLNKLHRLTRGSKSRTFVDQKDSDIVGTIAGEHGLSPKCDSTPITHKHVYQHNLTDLAFLRQRAARLGFEILVDDRDLHFRAPKLDVDSGLKLSYGEADSASGESIFLKRFSPRLSSATMVSEVEVRGWDPDKKEEIVGSFKAASSKLGQKAGYSETKSAFSDVKTFTVDSPIASVEEAKKLAEAKVGEMNMGYITGDGECRGTPAVKPGVVVTVEVNRDDSSDRFNGKYFITGATHRYLNAPSDQGGFVTIFRFSRDAEGPA